MPRIHEPSPTEFSLNPVSHNGLTHEYGARNFAQLREKRVNNPAARTENARRTHQAAPQGVQTPAVGRYDVLKRTEVLERAHAEVEIC